MENIGLRASVRRQQPAEHEGQLNPINPINWFKELTTGEILSLRQQGR